MRKWRNRPDREPISAKTRARICDYAMVALTSSDSRGARPKKTVCRANGFDWD